MTVPSESCRTTYVTNGGAVDFPTVWRFLANAHVSARFTPTGGVAQLLTEGVDYDLVGATLNGGGTLTTKGALSPLAAGALVVERTVPLTQLVDLRLQGTFSPAVHMTMFDQLAMGLQQLAARIAALEALGSLTSLAAFAAQVVQFELTTDPAEIDDSFPFDVAVAVGAGANVTGVLVASCSDPAGNSVESVQVRKWSWVANVLTIERITGLNPGTTYQFTLLCLSMEP